GVRSARDQSRRDSPSRPPLPKYNKLQSSNRCAVKKQRRSLRLTNPSVSQLRRSLLSLADQSLRSCIPSPNLTARRASLFQAPRCNLAPSRSKMLFPADRGRRSRSESKRNRAPSLSEDQLGRARRRKRRRRSAKRVRNLV